MTTETACWRCARTTTKRVPGPLTVADGKAEECADHLNCIEAQYEATQRQLREEYVETHLAELLAGTSLGEGLKAMYWADYYRHRNDPETGLCLVDKVADCEHGRAAWQGLLASGVDPVGGLGPM